MNFKHWEIFLFFVVVFFIPFSLFSNNFLNLIFKILIILFLSYLYYFTVFVFIYKKLNKLELKNEFKISKSIFYFRSILFLSLLILFLLDNSLFKMNSNEVGFKILLSIAIPLFFISSIMWFFFINYISKYLYFLEKKNIGAFSNYLGYFISFLFIPIGIFIVQPILNDIYDKEKLEI